MDIDIYVFIDIRKKEKVLKTLESIYIRIEVNRKMLQHDTPSSPGPVLNTYDFGI